MECIVHFEVKHKAEVKQLRGIIFIDDKQQPGDDELLEMFRDMNYNVTIADRDLLLFKPVDPASEYTSIRITELDKGEERYTEDRDLKSILSNLL
ncbi:hypothetical protein PNBC_15930 [Paenibacillus crassostreae]|uniref:Uncharacterized protein n=1 Tax=Paenibacillus crassostreae TaxID=1763538 RepID=A0A167BXB3_9BACL|nr:hypothetical protein [Paenibacillus crassostreae]AOZ94645.1 hypothetical protein LPB68_09485 [Paenibacillus crassostreae]OAB72549.1 hypothetical protein PNBC_15930 [Paenibacillus crassostreae]